MHGHDTGENGEPRAGLLFPVVLTPLRQAFRRQQPPFHGLRFLLRDGGRGWRPDTRRTATAGRDTRGFFAHRRDAMHRRGLWFLGFGGFLGGFAQQAFGLFAGAAFFRQSLPRCIQFVFGLFGPRFQFFDLLSRGGQFFSDSNELVAIPSGGGQGLVLRQFVMTDFRLQCLDGGLRFQQRAFGPVAGGGFSGQNGFDALQPAGGRTGRGGVRHVAAHDGDRNLSILHKPPAVHAAKEPAGTGPLRLFLPFALGPRSGSVAVQTKRAAHLRFSVVDHRLGLVLW